MSKASCVKVFGLGLIAAIVSGHVGSPDVFFAGRAGPYDVRVVVRPPQVVPGVARVTVRVPPDVERVSIRPVFWRAGSKGAPSADDTRRLDGAAGTFEGSLWLMARGAYTVDVAVTGPRGAANVLVPVASVATGRLAMNPVLAALLGVLGLVLGAGLITIVYKAAGESLVTSTGDLDPARRGAARVAAAVAVSVVGLAVLGGAKWWGAVDADYESTLYRPAPLSLTLDGSALRLQATDTIWAVGRPSAYMPDHGKLMHLFLVSADGNAFAHLHPSAGDSSTNPPFHTALPPLPTGRYHVYGDVVHETGFERTLVGSLDLAGGATRGWSKADPDDAWFAGSPSTAGIAVLADSSAMQLETGPDRQLVAGRDVALRVRVLDHRGHPVRLEPYLGMNAHAVVARTDGEVFVHLHPMGTITVASQQAFLARDRGDTTAAGRLSIDSRHDQHAATAATTPDADGVTEFPYAFPKSGDYRLFVQVKRSGRVLTASFAVSVAEPADTTR